ncbi:LysM peptidoglycan-binding domain-containing protein [Marinibaculum pumilum]|uniref:LysM peptidoglycan-binding domain-containing protein n=1 Tax=Marinibaculum pumilum TaxID=1766165 RepID=A0ABV7KYD6_9PROT
MNRSRVIIAVGIVVLILIGLFAWLGGDDPAESPVAGRPQEAGQDSTTAASSDTASPAETGAATGTTTDGQVGTDVDGESGGEGREAAEAAPDETAAPQAAAVESGGETTAARPVATSPETNGPESAGPESATNSGNASDRSATASTADDSGIASRAPSSGADAASGQVAEVTEAPDAGTRPAAADAGGDGSTGGMGSGTVAEMQPPRRDAPAEQAQSTTQPAEETPASGTTAVPKPEADEQPAAGEREVAALPPERTAPERQSPDRQPAAQQSAGQQSAGQQSAGQQSAGQQSAGQPPPTADEPRAGDDRPSGSRDARDDAGRPAGETPEQTTALEHRTREGTGSATSDTSGTRAGPSDQVSGAVGAPLPSFDIVRISQDCRAVIAGRAMPRAVVEVSLGEDLLGQVTADRRGEWVLIPDQPLRPGPGEMRLSVTPQDGPSVTGREGVIVSVPDCGGGEGEGQEIIAVRTDDRDSRPSRVLQLPGMSGPGGDLRLDAVDYDEAGKLILSGRAEPSTRVNIYANNAPVGQVRTDDEGRWSLLVDDKVPLGPQTLRLDQVGARGTVKSRVEFPFSRASFSDLDLNDRNVIVQPGNSLWRIARRVYGEGLRYTVIYKANAEQIRDPDLIYPGQIFSLPGEGGEGEAASRG